MSSLLLVVVAAVCAGLAPLALPGRAMSRGPSRPSRRKERDRGLLVRAGTPLRRLLGGAPEAPVGELLSGLAAELAAGQPPSMALEHAAAACSADPCPRARRAARAAGDVAAALREDARATGAGDLAGLAACWEVAAHSGAGLAQAVTRLADGLRSARAARGQLAAEVAAARASAKLLAALPLFGLAIGQWLGGQPLAWLLGSWVGRLVLMAGLALELLGLTWLQRMVGAVRSGL